MGYSYYHYRKDKKMGKPNNSVVFMVKKFRLIRLIFKILGLGIMVLTITIVGVEQKNPGSWGRFTSTVYLSQGGNLFIVGFILFIFPSIISPKSILNSLFKPAFWPILAKLTFIFSLVGGMVILFRNYSLY